MSPRPRTSLRRIPTTLAVALALLTSACGGGSSPASSGGASEPKQLVLGAVAPFTGPDADFGPTAMAGCVPAAKLINEAGGVLGHTFKCVPVDTRGDPADAVPAVQKLIAATSGLVGIVGPTSDDTASTAPVIDAAGIPFSPSTGQAIFDHNTYRYFYRLTPADDVAGYAMALWGHARGYQRAAAIFGNDIGSQGTVPTLLRGLSKLGSPQVVINETLNLDQASYRSEVERMIAADPQVIFTEIDPQTAGTFFSELKQLHKTLIPVIGADPTLDPTWFQAVSGAIGADNLSRLFTAENPVGAHSGAAWELYQNALLASSAEVRDAQGYTTDGVAQARYNAVNLFALAMLEAKSVIPRVYAPYIVKVATGSPGAVRVYTFAEGKTALAEGKRIQYVGLGSGISFDRWHNSPGQLEIDHFTPTGDTAAVPGVAEVTAAQITALSQ